MEMPDKKTVIRDLIELGKSKGQLSTKEILDALGELDFEPEQIEKFYDTLESQGVEIIEDFANIPLEGLDIPSGEGEDVEAALATEGIAIDDPLRYTSKRLAAFRCSPPKRKSIWPSAFQTETKPQRSASPKRTFVWSSASPSVTLAAECSSST